MKPNNFLSALLLLLVVSTNGFTQTINVNVDYSSVLRVSKFSPGMSLIDKTMYYDSPDNNTGAVASARNLMKNGLKFINTHIMAWGPGNPWPIPSSTEPTYWTSLDSNMSIIRFTGKTPVITLCEAPWWMKGRLEADGTTTMVTEANEWEPIAYESRVLDNKMTQWIKLVRRVAERYMVAPYNVRHFSVWNELKGYYNPSTNSYDYNSSAGVPSGSNAKHGFTYMYNLVYQEIRQVATEKGIALSSIKIGGPYPSLSIGSSANSMSHPSSVTGPWGVLDKRGLDAMSYWLTNKLGGEFISLDGYNTTTFGSDNVDAFGMCDMFAAANNWIRAQNGGSAIPIWWTEWYVKRTGLPATNAAFNAVGAYATIKQITSDVSVILLWGGTEDPSDTDPLLPPMWTSTSISGGGQALPWYSTYKKLGELFNAGKTLYTTSSSSTRVAAMATANTVLLVNKTNSSKSVKLNGGTTYTLAAYEVKFITTSPLFSTNDAPESNGSKLKLYPNPATNMVIFDAGREVIKEISIYNTQGGLVTQLQTGPKSRTEIRTNGWAAGSYTAVITTNAGTYQEKLIITP